MLEVLKDRVSLLSWLFSPFRCRSRFSQSLEVPHNHK